MLCNLDLSPCQSQQLLIQYIYYATWTIQVLNANLAHSLSRQQDVPCCQISVDKGLLREEFHSRGDLMAEV